MLNMTKQKSQELFVVGSNEEVKNDIIQMYSTLSGLTVESKGRESFSFSLIQRESRELLLPLSLSSLRQNPPNNQRTISHPSPLDIYWFFGNSVQFCNPSDFQPTTNCSLLPQISFEPYPFFFIFFENRFCNNPHPMWTFCKTSPRPALRELPLPTVEHNIPGFIKVCRLEWQPWEGKGRGCIYTHL